MQNCNSRNRGICKIRQLLIGVPIVIMTTCNDQFLRHGLFKTTFFVDNFWKPRLKNILSTSARNVNVTPPPHHLRSINLSPTRRERAMRSLMPTYAKTNMEFIMEPANGFPGMFENHLQTINFGVPCYFSVEGGETSCWDVESFCLVRRSPSVERSRLRLGEFSSW